MRKTALLFACLPAALHAQQLTAPVPDTEQLVVTATRTPVPASDVAAGVTVIDRATIQARGYIDLVQVLSDVPGLRVAQSGGPGSTASVFMRGTNSNQVLVLRDGVPINDPGDPGGLFNFGVDSLNDIERIEIIRGPMSSVYGTGGTQTTGLARANVGGSEGIWDFNANAESFSTRGFDQTPPRESIYTGEVDGDREQLGSIDLGVTPIEGTRISLDLRGRTSKYGYDEQGFVTYDGGNATGEDNTASGILAAVSHLLDNALTTSLSVARVLDDRRYIVTYDPADPNDDTENDHYHGRRTDVEWNNSLSLPDYAFTDRNTLTAGYQYQQDSSDTRIVSLSGGYPYDSATVAQDDTNSFYLGARSRLYQALTVDGQIREDSTSDAGSAFTWRLGGVFAIDAIDTRLKASYGTGFRAPALFDRYGVDSYGYMGNPNLRPERSQGWEAGIETDLPIPAAMGNATLAVTYFNNRITDLIELVYSPVYTSVNIASASTQGIETTFALRLNQWLQADLAYTYTDARNLQTGTQLLRRPYNQAAADLRITPIEKLTIAPELTYTGAFQDYLIGDNGEGQGTGLAPSGLILNLNITYQLYPHIKLFAWGKNLSNSRFEPVSGYITPGASGLFGVQVGF
jgi:vitamin B12 transporter